MEGATIARGDILWSFLELEGSGDRCVVQEAINVVLVDRVTVQERSVFSEELIRFFERHC